MKKKEINTLGIILDVRIIKDEFLKVALAEL